MSTIATQQRTGRFLGPWIALLVLIAVALGAASMAVFQTVTSKDEIVQHSTVIPFVDAAVQGRALNESAVISPASGRSTDFDAIQAARTLNGPIAPARSSFSSAAVRDARALNGGVAPTGSAFSVKTVMDLRSLNAR